jgi:hypothetical protein
MHYRMGKSGAWIPYTAGTVIPLNAGESVQFWNSENTLSTSRTNNANFAISKKVAASGNVQSLMNFRSDCPGYCFASLFSYSATYLSKLPLFPAKTLGSNCYFNMFSGCKYLDATRLVLPAEFAQECYAHAFQNVENGLESVEILGTVPAYNCLYSAFRYCYKLKEIKVHFTSWTCIASNGTENNFSPVWVEGVSKTGTFYKPSALPEEYGTGRIPEGWTVINID